MDMFTTWKVYQNAKNTLEHFKQKFKLDQICPSHITHIVNCIHHMPTYKIPSTSKV
jgi:hypothetical protein